MGSVPHHGGVPGDGIWTCGNFSSEIGPIELKLDAYDPYVVRSIGRNRDRAYDRRPGSRRGDRDCGRRGVRRWGADAAHGAACGRVYGVNLRADILAVGAGVLVGTGGREMIVARGEIDEPHIIHGGWEKIARIMCIVLRDV